MKEHEKWHEPQTITDAKNAVGHFVVFGFVLYMLIWLGTGLIAPLLLPKWLIEAKLNAKDQAAQGKGTYEKNYSTLRIEAIARSIIQFILAWGLIWFAFKSNSIG